MARSRACPPSCSPGQCRPRGQAGTGQSPGPGAAPGRAGIGLHRVFMAGIPAQTCGAARRISPECGSQPLPPPRRNTLQLQQSANKRLVATTDRATVQARPRTRSASLQLLQRTPDAALVLRQQIGAARIGDLVRIEVSQQQRPRTSRSAAPVPRPGRVVRYQSARCRKPAAKPDRVRMPGQRQAPPAAAPAAHHPSAHTHPQARPRGAPLLPRRNSSPGLSQAENRQGCARDLGQLSLQPQPVQAQPQSCRVKPSTNRRLPGRGRASAAVPSCRRASDEPPARATSAQHQPERVR